MLMEDLEGLRREQVAAMVSEEVACPSVSCSRRLRSFAFLAFFAFFARVLDNGHDPVLRILRPVDEPPGMHQRSRDLDPDGAADQDICEEAAAWKAKLLWQAAIV